MPHFKLHYVPERRELVTIGFAAEGDCRCLKLMLLQLLLFHRIRAGVAVGDSAGLVEAVVEDTPAT